MQFIWHLSKRGLWSQCRSSNNPCIMLYTSSTRFCTYNAALQTPNKTSTMARFSYKGRLYCSTENDKVAYHDHFWIKWWNINAKCHVCYDLLDHLPISHLVFLHFHIFQQCSTLKWKLSSLTRSQQILQNNSKLSSDLMNSPFLANMHAVVFYA